VVPRLQKVNVIRRAPINQPVLLSNAAIRLKPPEQIFPKAAPHCGEKAANVLFPSGWSVRPH